MILKIHIRSETSDDIAAIAEVTVAAFHTLEISNHTEHSLLHMARLQQMRKRIIMGGVDRN
jgi:putative acetyltransferase